MHFNSLNRLSTNNLHRYKHLIDDNRPTGKLTTNDDLSILPNRNDQVPKAAPKEEKPVDGDNCYAMTKWRQEKIWIEAVDRENRSKQEWTDKWSFLADYDQKGNLKEKARLPSRVNMYSDKLPSSCGHMYGYRIDKQEAAIIKNLENALQNKNYKKQKNSVFLCYD